MAGEPIATIPVDGGRIAYRRLGNGRPLLVVNGFAATSADWDPSFIDRLASASELVLVDNRGIGASTDDGAPFDIGKLAEDAVRVIETLDLRVPERARMVHGWLYRPNASFGSPELHSQAHPAFHRSGQSLRGTRLVRRPTATNRYVWHSSRASSTPALTAVSGRRRGV